MASNRPALFRNDDHDPAPAPSNGGLRNVRFGAPADDDYFLDLTELPDGTYPAHVTELELEFGGMSGQPYYLVTFEIDAPEEHQGHQLSTVVSFAPQARSWTVQKLTALVGHELPQRRVNIADPVFQAQFVGRPAILQIAARVDDNGYRTSEVRAILPPQEVTDGND